MSDYNNILQDLQSLNLNKASPVFVPTQQREILFTPLTVKQQKDIIKGSLDATSSNVLFNKVTNDIINKNSVEDIEYFVIDKPSILIHFRLQSLGPDINIPDPDNEDISYDINLEEHAETFKTILPTDDTIGTTIQYENIVAEIKVPNLATDSKFTDDTKKSLESITSGDLTETIGNLYIFELIKFLNKITIGERTVDVSNLSIPQAITIIEAFPITLSNKIVKFIEATREFEVQYTSVKTPERVLELPIDATFFNGP